MAFYVYMYGTYADDIKKAFGSKDKALIELMFSDAEDVAYYEDIQENNFNVSYAIMDIIYGVPLNNPARYIYGYALIELAKKLGKSLPYLQEIRVGEGTDGIKKFLASDFDIKNVDLVQHLLGCTHPFLIPKIDDFPFIGLISNDGLASIRAIFGHC
ncbi:MAG: hypothetical protein Q4C68_01530 [Moraxella sp.]|nr:hypothetical protein [Moraxella sp.]